MLSMNSQSPAYMDSQMFSVEMAIFVEGTLLAQEYAVSPTFLIPQNYYDNISGFSKHDFCIIFTKGVSVYKSQQ